MSEILPTDAPEGGPVDAAEADSPPGRHVGDDMVLLLSSFVGRHPRHRVDPAPNAESVTA